MPGDPGGYLIIISAEDTVSSGNERVQMYIRVDLTQSQILFNFKV